MTTYNKRKHARREFHWSAVLRNGDGGQIRDCYVYDISEGGARISVPGRESDPAKAEEILPRQFVLSMTPDNKVVRFCERVWARGNELGVRFLSGRKTD